ncbi:mitochondrial coenzyme A diphosphatase NUDT8-like [Liolophura sinensis]|uniref:mitochondrial coenzyme A diphosphatase NUDT8-like n=1 Tax=Liolophura sinensis TaxID=3198878 RepID=UPI0031581509
MHCRHCVLRLTVLTSSTACNQRPPQVSTSTVRHISVTLDTIFSRQNELRIRTSLMTVKPVRKPSGSGRGGEASVLVPLCTVNKKPSILFTLRSSALNSHSGHVSFPGGKKDDTDPNLVYTALRETEEELGLSESQVDVWGELLPSPSRNGLTVTPVIGFCGELDVDLLKPNQNEVEAVFTRTISSLCNPANTRMTHFRTGAGYILPVYLGGPHRIWGLSAVFLHQVLTILAPGLYKFKIPMVRHVR